MFFILKLKEIKNNITSSNIQTSSLKNLYRDREQYKNIEKYKKYEQKQ